MITEAQEQKLKYKFEVSVEFEVSSEEQALAIVNQMHKSLGFGTLENLPIQQAILDHKGIVVVKGETDRALQTRTLNITKSLGDKVFGNFNPTGDPFVEEIKERCARVYDLIETLKTNGRITAMTKTAAQTQLLHAQMDAVKCLFLPEGL